jgi:hypothetical protein
MHKPKKIIAIYNELKSSIGQDQSDKELLLAAHQILGAFEKGNSPRTSNISISEGALPLEYRELTEAFSDGGWQIMMHETAILNEYYADEKDEISESVKIDNWFLGLAA